MTSSRSQVTSKGPDIKRKPLLVLNSVIIDWADIIVRFGMSHTNFKVSHDPDIQTI